MKRTPDNQDVIDDPNGRERIVVERVIEKQKDSNGFGSFKDLVFTAIILGAGGVIWAQQSKLAEHDKAIAVLQLKCRNLPLERGTNE